MENPTPAAPAASAQPAAPAVPAAPAAPAAAPAAPAPTTQSAAHAAVASGDTTSYRNARRAERVGKPLPEVPVSPATPAPAATTEAQPGAPAAPAAPAQPPKPKPIRVTQEYINERIRSAVDSALQAERARSQPPAAPAAPPAPAEPEWKRYAAMPDAPKLDDFDSLADHSAAMALFIADKRHADRTQAEQARTHDEQMTAAQRARVDGFVGKLNEARAADPEFVNKLTPEVRALKPFDALLPGESGGPLNVVAEQIFDSPVADKVLLHLSQHPQDLQRLATVPAHIERMPRAVRAQQHIQWIVREFGKLEGSLATPPAPAPAPAPTPQPKTLTDVADVQTLGTRPAEATDQKAHAIRTGNTKSYRAIRRAERAAALVP